MTKNDYDRIEKIAFQLESNISAQTAREIEKARNFDNGYKQAISDLLKVAKDHIGCADIPST